MAELHNDYYTYAFLREDKTPYYIGKGRGERIYSANRLINPPTDKSRIIFLKKNLTEAEAFKHEVYMIFVLGRKDLGTGILRNLTNGGEGTSGRVYSEETRKRMSVAMSGDKNPQFGAPRTKETKKKIKEGLAGKNAGENSPMYGKTGVLNPKSMAIIAIQPDGTELPFGSGCEAARELGIDQSNLCGRYLKTGNVLKKGKFKGWRFVFENRQVFGVRLSDQEIL
jgi:hypothetical protein